MDHTFGKQPDAKARHDDQTIEDAIEEYLTELDEKIVEGMNEEPIGTDRKLTKQYGTKTFSTMSVMNYQPTLNTLPEELPSPVNSPAFTFNSSFTEIKTFLLQQASKKGLQVIRNDEVCLMLGKKKAKTCARWLFNCCWNFHEEDERDIYELARVKSRRKSKAILKQISGKQQGFQSWKRQFLTLLWKKKILQPDLPQAINFALEDKSQQIQLLCNLYKQTSIQFTDHKSLELLQHELSTLMGRVHELEKSLQKILKNDHNFILDSPTEKLLHCELFKQLQLSTIYAEVLEKEKLEWKKNRIKQNWRMKNVFEQLELEYAGQDGFERKINQFTIEELPYYQLVIYLDSLSLEGSPLSEIGKISTFCRKFQMLPSRKTLIEMDNQLPLIILCCLLANNEMLKQTTLLLVHYWQRSECYELEKRTLAAINASLQFIENEWKQKP